MLLFITVAKGSLQISLFSLRSLGGMILLMEAFLISSAAISFSTAVRFTVVNEKTPLTTFSLISLILE